MENAKREFGERLYQARKKAGLKQVELSEKMDMSVAIVSKWENGAYTPTFCTLLKLAKALGVTVGWLAAGEDA